MKARIAINGFGRIGRMVFRTAIEEEKLDIVAINASYPAETLAHLIKYDSIHGPFAGEVICETDALIVNGKRIQLLDSRDPLLLPWKQLQIDLVIEATGKFNSREKAQLHIEAGAQKVVLTAPGKDEDVTIVMGVNEKVLDVHKHHIISNASCTTNCLAPVVKVLDEAFTIENGLMTTVHAYTNDQKILITHIKIYDARAHAVSPLFLQQLGLPKHYHLCFLISVGNYMVWRCEFQRQMYRL